MQNDPLIHEIENYCTQAGISPSTFGVRAVGNSRFLDRLKRRSAEADRIAGKARAYMAANPPAQNVSEAAK